MFKKQIRFFISLLGLGDLIAALCSWVLAYYIRFYVEIIPVTKGIPEFKLYLFLTPFVVLIWGVTFKVLGLYEPRRLRSFGEEIFSIVKGSTLSFLVLIVTSYFLQEYKFSRMVFIYFYLLSIFLSSSFRFIVHWRLTIARRKGENLKFALIVGEGRPAKEILDTIRHHPELAVHIQGVLHRKPVRGGQMDGVEILGGYGDLQKVIREKAVDQVFIALSIFDNETLESILKLLEDEIVDVILVPDIFHYASFRGCIEEFDGLPLINLRASPLYGWNRILKRSFDLICSAAALLLSLPLMAVIALIMKVFSPGPIFYKQERMGLDGEPFPMFKFRTMKVGAEDETGPIWATLNDPRRTKMGRILRKTSIDELPQLFNVLKGEMSLVGPRPERPVFIEKFRASIPKYMLRHKMKAGVTGWAQVNGWRGDTSLEKRIEHDLYYIENWSLSLDCKILMKTIPVIFHGKGAM